MDLTPKQQTSEAIRQAETILITTGQRPSVDQVAATLALAAILRKFGKKVSAIISDQLPPTAQWINSNGLETKMSGLRDFVLKVNTSKVEVDSLRYEPEGDHLNIYITPFQGGFAPSDVTFGYGNYHYDLVIVLGVPRKSSIDRVISDNASVFEQIPMINIDFHRVNENYGAVNLVEPAASSLCEMLVATSESLQSGLIDAEIATTMLGGIMAATDRFTANHTTSKSLTVAAQMMAAGADQPTVVRGLYGVRDNRANQDRPARTDAVSGPFPARNVAPAKPAAAVEAAPVPQSAPTEPILEPDHIELMSAQMAHDESAAEELSPAPAAEVLPMADFTAAAEILRNREAELPAEA